MGLYFKLRDWSQQVEKLSPLLVTLYLNDLETFLFKAYNGLERLSRDMQEYTQTEDLVLYLKLFPILYADDKVIMAELASEVQAALDGMAHYCRIWKLKVNTSKTKVVIFGANPNKVKDTFKLNDLHLNIVSSYDYIGISFKHNGNLYPGIVKLRDQVSPAMYALFNKSRKLCLSIDVQLHLFDSLVVPVALYGSEV